MDGILLGSRPFFIMLNPRVVPEANTFFYLRPSLVVCKHPINHVY